MENAANVPFTHNWTLRISKAPSNIQVSDDAPDLGHRGEKEIFKLLEEGFNRTSTFTITGSERVTTSNKCFYVVLSIDSVENFHAASRIISKASSVAVFAFGTALFASASLLSVSVSLMVLSLVLSAGVWGRVTAMWIAHQMNKVAEPILHAVVRTRSEAVEYMEEILKIKPLVVEVQGHVIINGRVICRRNPWLCLSRYIGLLASPFDVVKHRIRTDGSGRYDQSLSGSTRAESTPSENHDQGLLNANMTAGDAV